MAPANNSLQQVTVLVPVREIPLALAFYRDMLGLTVIAENHAATTLAGDDGPPAVVLQATHERGPSHAHGDPIARLVFARPAFEEIRARLLKAAFAFRITRDHPAEIVARDLDGNDILLGAAE